jgi:hypothetical protein
MHQPDANVWMKKDITERTMEMKYVLRYRDKNYGNIKHEVTKANRVADCLNDTIWRNRYFRKETKSRVYKAVVRPIMTEEIDRTPLELNRLVAASEMEVLRKITSRTLLQRVKI